MTPRAVLLDLDGTLYRSLPVKAGLALQLLRAGRLTLRTLRTFRREHERLRHEPSAGGEDVFARQLRQTAARLQRPESEVRAVVESWMFQRPLPLLRAFRRHDLIAAVIAFREDGGRVAVVSDYPATAKIAALGMSGLVEAIVAPAEQNAPARLKPDAAGCLLAARLLDVAPHHCLMIGDRPDTDGAAARAAGMTFFHVSERTAWRASLCRLPARQRPLPVTSSSAPTACRDLV